MILLYFDLYLFCTYMDMDKTYDNYDYLLNKT